jgi:hypothetical protein
VHGRGFYLYCVVTWGQSEESAVSGAAAALGWELQRHASGNEWGMNGEGSGN